MNDKPTVALIGAGAMGGALLKGWLHAGTIAAKNSAVFDPAASDEIAALCKRHGVAINPTETRFDAMVVAIKPQMVGKVLPNYAGLATNAIVISVMAGTSVSALSDALGGATRVARAMPNLPASIGRGVSGLFAPDAIDREGRDLIETLMHAAGDVVWVQSEEEINAVTAVSGSGPAYFFLMTEALADAGIAQGLTPDAARALARATLCGAGALLDVETRAPDEMRVAVTSPGGTTEAALKVLDGDEKSIRKLMSEAVKTAADRAAALTK